MAVYSRFKVFLTLLLTLTVAAVNGHELNSVEVLTQPSDLNDKLVALKNDLKDIKKDILDNYAHEKLLWQVHTFANWFQAESKEKCQTPPSFIFDKWLPIQRRFDGSLNFNRNWLQYEQGFGDHQNGGEFFLGLQQLYNMSQETPLELLILLGDHEKQIAYAKYDNFVLASPGEDYAIKSLSNYQGTAGDALTPLVGHKFSTKDRDNDNSKLYNCSELRGGWWFKFCFQR